MSDTETVSLSKVIAVLERIGYTQVAKHGDLAAFDTMQVGGGYPIILDMSMEEIPMRDIVGQLEEAGVHLPVFYEELHQV